MCEGPKCGKAGGNPESVLVARLGNGKHGWSAVVHKVQSGKVVVEAGFDANAMQLEESRESRRLKHKTLPCHVNRDEHDARQIAHLQFRSRSGETVVGEDRRGRTISSCQTRHFHNAVKAVLNCLESGPAFSAMSEDGVEARLALAREAIGPTDRTRLIKMRAVKNPVCKTPKAKASGSEL